MTLYETFLKSTELKKLVVTRSFEHKIPLRFLCKETGIKYRQFMLSYINSSNTTDKEVFTEQQFCKLLGILGIEIRFTFVVDTKMNMKAVSEALRIKHSN